MTLTLAETPQRERTKLSVIDCDIHNYLPSEKTVREYMPERWRQHLDAFGVRIPHGMYYPLANMHAARTDAWPPSGQIPGSDLSFVQKQLLDLWDMQYGVLFPLTGAGKQLNLAYSAAMSTAVNEWQSAEWLDPEPRLRASMAIPYEDGPLAVTEIERFARDPRFIQVIFESRTLEPLGRRRYWPIYEAAARHGLPIGMHFGALGGWPIGSGIGHPSFYIEYHTGQMTSFQDQMISLVCEGVFEEFPDLKFVLIEGGFGWLPPLMWRLDRAYGRLKSEVPHLKRLPSEYIREHFWFTTQPVEEPHNPRDFQVLLDDLGMDDRIMFSTDYPHWDFDSPETAIPSSLPADRRRDIMSENARKLYRLP